MNLLGGFISLLSNELQNAINLSNRMRTNNSSQKHIKVHLIIDDYNDVFKSSIRFKVKFFETLFQKEGEEFEFNRLNQLCRFIFTNDVKNFIIIDEWKDKIVDEEDKKETAFDKEYKNEPAKW